MKKILLCLFPLLVAIFLLHYFLIGQAVYGDGIYYWSYVRTVYIDRDLKLSDELSHHYNHLYNNTNLPNVVPKDDPNRIALEFHLPFGPSIAWVPFFAIGDCFARLAHEFNPQIVLNGYSDFYQISVGIGNILYVLVGLYFVYLLVKKYFDKKVASIATLLLFFTSNLFYYGSLDVVNSHPFSFFLSSMLLYYFFVKFSSRWYQWLFLGMLIGLLILTRTQEIVFGIVFLAGLVKGYKNGMRVLLWAFVSLMGLIIVISPQLLLLQYVYHGFFKSPYLLGGSFHFLMPHVLGLLINGKTGLLFTSPIILIGVGGLVLLAKQKKYIGIVGLLLFLAEYYVISSWSAWDQAASYGIRMLISTFPVVAVGIGYIVQIIVKRFSYKIVYIVGAVLFVFNLAMIVRFHLVVKTPTRDAGTITRIEAQKKLNSILHTNFQFFKK